VVDQDTAQAVIAAGGPVIEDQYTVENVNLMLDAIRNGKTANDVVDTEAELFAGAVRAYTHFAKATDAFFTAVGERIDAQYASTKAEAESFIAQQEAEAPESTPAAVADAALD
jgi:exonuclease III